jgi:hypothetical protein
VRVCHTLEEGIKDADVVITLRLQNERMSGALLPSSQEFAKSFGLTRDRLQWAKPDAIIVIGCPLLQAIIEPCNNVVKTVFRRHSHATRDALSIQEHALISTDFAWQRILKTNPLTVYISSGGKLGAIALDARLHLQLYDLRCHLESSACNTTQSSNHIGYRQP